MLVTLMFAILEFFVYAIGFSFGFWLLTMAAKDEGWRKLLGQIVGWVLIVYSLIISLMIAFVWIDYIRTGKVIKCPMCSHHKSQLKEYRDHHKHKNKMHMKMTMPQNGMKNNNSKKEELENSNNNSN